ncbi:hypothetical protein THRCLA_08443, partial [Thraustotheca clavata]
MDELLNQLSDDAKDFWMPKKISRIPPPTAVEFYRDYVSKNIPVIITNAINHWPALQKWTDEYFDEAIGNEIVTVDVTPTGYGDAVLTLENKKTQVFVQPEERNMTFSKFLEIYHDKQFDGVPYLSHQNDSLREQFPQLVHDVDRVIDFSAEAFGNMPEAVNLWIGDDRAVSTMHKDHYENMYCVVRGLKHFILLPPSDVAFLHETEYPTTRYVHKSNVDQFDPSTLIQSKNPNWFIHMPPEGRETTPWIPVDPVAIDTDKFPKAKHIQPLEVVLEEGEMLYLPSLWYHRATQLCDTVSVNYWHDMEFDAKYVYFNFLHVTTTVHGGHNGIFIFNSMASAKLYETMVSYKSSFTPPKPVEQVWNFSPPVHPRILKHQILRKVPPTSNTPIPTIAVPGARKVVEAPKTMPSYQSKVGLLELRRQVEERLAQDRNEDLQGRTEWWKQQ